MPTMLSNKCSTNTILSNNLPTCIQPTGHHHISKCTELSLNITLDEQLKDISNTNITLDELSKDINFNQQQLKDN